MTNNCWTQETWEVALPVDSAGRWNVVPDVTVAANTSVTCQAYSVDQTAQLVATSSGTITGPGPISLTEQVNAAGSLYVACFLPFDATVNTINWSACGGASEAPCPGNSCDAGLNYDSASDRCLACGLTGEACCPSTIGPATDDPWGSCLDGSQCGGTTCLKCPANAPVLGNDACYPKTATWTTPETDYSGWGIHPTTLTITWPSSYITVYGTAQYSWVGAAWGNYGPLYANLDDDEALALTGSDGTVYAVLHTGTMSGFGNIGDTISQSGTFQIANWSTLVSPQGPLNPNGVQIGGSANLDPIAILANIGVVAGAVVVFGSGSAATE